MKHPTLRPSHLQSSRLALRPEICERARQSRDARFDGRFFVGVLTTGIYCRPVCPVRPPKPENVRFFPTAAAAAEAGLRPCLRCRPELSAGTPDWSGSSDIVDRALRLIADGEADEGVAALAERLGITPRHLQRLFQRHLGASPVSVLRTRRLHLAKRLIDETDLRMADIAFAAGFGSVRRFNATFRELYGRSPRQLRQVARSARPRPAEGYTFRLAYRPPFHWPSMLSFLARRTVPGVEEARDGVYRRTFEAGEETGVLEVRHIAASSALELRLSQADACRLLTIVERVRRLFDLGADPGTIHRHLRGDSDLRPYLVDLAGARVPGTLDGFELAVRAILGQQVSVAAACTLAGRLAQRHGKPLREPVGTLGRCFPTARSLADADLDGLGITGARIRSIRALAGAVADGELRLQVARPEELRRRLLELPGIGAWTADYIALRLGEPDAFPASDLGLLKSPANGGARNARELSLRAEAWRPWRAYAAIALWNAYGGRAA